MNLRQAAQRALKAMEDGEYRADMIEFSDALIALRAALAEPEQPVACSNTFSCRCPKHFTAPTPRKPVELTDEELEPLMDAVQCYDIGNSDLLDFARAVISAYEKKQGAQT